MRIFAAIAFMLTIALPYSSYASGPEVVLKNNVFYAPGKGLYVESDMLVIGNTLTYRVNPRNKYTGAVRVLILFKQGKKVIQADKYNLSTIDIDDTSNINVGIVSKKRYVLPSGTYTVEATYTDTISKEVRFITQTLVMKFDSSKTEMSDIALVESYVKVKDDGTAMADGTPMNKDYIKSGLYMTPMVVNFFPEMFHKLKFYAEAYPLAGSTDTMLVMFTIRKYGTIEPFENFGYSKKVAPKEVIPLFGEFDITALPTGNYDLVVELRDKKNNVIADKKFFFQRSKSDGPSAEELSRIKAEGTFVGQLDITTLKYQLKTIRPLCDMGQVNRIRGLLKSTDLPTIQKFFLSFWMMRNPNDPYGAWVAYEEKVKQVNRQFGTPINYGFDTDRGRVYLQYGAPNQMLDMPSEPSAFPYQIWQYYSLGKQSNVKFVFYNHDMVTNEYELIHSNGYGEVRNEQWQRLVYQGATVVSPTEDGTTVQDHYGSKGQERFGNP